ncbi:MAG: GrpB family protein [Clostridia bacterium]|nr:GrpB family protein [Clostridia bacterium]
MLGLERGTVKLFAHEHAWDDHGAQYCARISAALGDFALAVEHVGSTSVSGLCAKPIIDIAVGVQSLDLQIVERMERAGFRHRPSHDDAHNMLFVDGEGEMRRAHIHVVIHMGMEWRNYVNFRDYLRTFEDVRQEYGALKQSLAKQYANDRVAYTDAKADFISYHLRKAMVWSYLGKHIEAEIDRPIGYLHVKGNKQLLYPVNYGYIPGVLGGDGEELDVYCLGAEQPLERFEGNVIAIVHRADDVEDKLVACVADRDYDAHEICCAIYFQERFYDTTVQTVDGQILHISDGVENGN